MACVLVHPVLASWCVCWVVLLQVQRERKRVAKWRRMLGSSAADFEAYCSVKMKKVKKRVRKGIPDEFRGYAWQLLSGAGQMLHKLP